MAAYEDSVTVPLVGPTLNWVRHDDLDVILTGGAVRAGELVRLQARWEPAPAYLGPERFTISRSRSYLARLAGREHRAEDIEMWADVDGPPVTHSRGSWQAGNVDQFCQQSRYLFRDAHGYRSGQLTVSNVAHYTTEPTFSLEGRITAPLPIATDVTGVIARAGRAKTIYHVGATSDPRVRITLMTPAGDGGRNDLAAYLRAQAPSLGGGPGQRLPPRLGEILRTPHQLQWEPAFESGQRELTLDVDESQTAEISVVPEREYAERGVPFVTAFALRVEDVRDASRFVVSDVVTVEGGDLGYPSRYREGQLLFRA
jgi:hypothetical protein